MSNEYWNGHQFSFYNNAKDDFSEIETDSLHSDEKQLLRSPQKFPYTESFSNYIPYLMPNPVILNQNLVFGDKSVHQQFPIQNSQSLITPESYRDISQSYNQWPVDLRFPYKPTVNFVINNSDNMHNLNNHDLEPDSTFGSETEEYELNSGNTKNKCTKCGKIFTRFSSLQTHQLIHTGVKPFICPWPGCLKKFNVKSNMNRHFKLHDREK